MGVKLKAKGRFVVIQPHEISNRKSKSGLVIPNSVDSDVRFRKGLVVSVGDEVQGVSEGEIVLYNKQSTASLYDKYVIVPKPDIICSVEN
jgi:co-chaperonin GroES (HSP10)